MNYEVTDGNIVITDRDDFNIEHILDCGQVFRYRKEGDEFTLCSKNENCLLKNENDCVIIKTNNVGYFVDYFDLDNDYSKIKRQLKEYPNMADAINYGHGIRLLNQDPLEMIISFIISANNNIPRIKGIIERMCTSLGENMGDYYAFPTLDALQGADVTFFKSIGAGYRAEYLVKVSKQLSTLDYEGIRSMDTATARRTLVGLMGVGNKVADCILLFAYKKTDLFPMDTWSKKIYAALGNEPTDNSTVMSKNLVAQYGELSGYAQQYLYYYYRQTSN